MKKFWSKRILDAVPYVPGEQPKGQIFIKLNTNENPYPPSPKVAEAIRGVDADRLRLYSDPACTPLVQAVADYHGVKPEQVFAGNGSDEVLAFAFQAFFDADRPVAFPDITYSFYEVYVNYFQLAAKLIPLEADFSMPLDAFVKGGHGGIVLTNPNAPTGLAVGLESVRQVLKANPDCVVIVDEAYVDFGTETAVPLLEEFDNLLVVRTLSKSRSLAGLRVGYALGSENLIQGLCCVRDSINSYTVDTLAQVGATAAMKDVDWFQACCQKIMMVREKTVPKLESLGFHVIPSKANFLFVTHPDHQAKDLLMGLRQEGILVRYFQRPRIDQYLRITVGDEDEMEKLCVALEKLTK